MKRHTKQTTAMHSNHGYIKICGITNEADADLVIEAGADALGLNLWAESPRHVSLDVAERIAAHVRGRIAVFAVTVNMPRVALDVLQQRVAPDYVQLHGEEPDALVAALAPRGVRAVGLATEADVERALRVAGDWVLVDARDEVLRGGTGRAPPLVLAARVCAARRTLLAGGLHPDNVAAAIAAVHPAGVDVASGVEAAPGHKSPERVRRFVAAARAAFARRTDAAKKRIL